MLINAFNIQKEINTKCIPENISNICYHGDVIAIWYWDRKSTFAKYFIKFSKTKCSVLLIIYYWAITLKIKLSAIWMPDD